MSLGTIHPIAAALINPDPLVAGWFRARLTPSFTQLLWSFSAVGSELWIGLAVGALLVWFVARRAWRWLICLMLTVPLGALMGEAIKLLVHRPRPFAAGPFGLWGGYSFPSGHTISATLLYGFVLMLLTPMLSRRRWRWMLTMTGALLVLCVAFSRVALGAHYLTDVIGAMVLGSTWLLVCSAALDHFWPRTALEQSSASVGSEADRSPM
jgi:undecaprenyl-diphosphatase